MNPNNGKIEFKTRKLMTRLQRSFNQQGLPPSSSPSSSSPSSNNEKGEESPFLTYQILVFQKQTTTINPFTLPTLSPAKKKTPTLSPQRNQHEGQLSFLPKTKK
ncbi:hypothetical protein ACTFIZ_006773 [Dictyostelium cf. discoideum]